MKKWFVIVNMLLIFILGGCATFKSPYYSTVKEDVYLDATYVWSNNPVKYMFAKDSDLRGITLRIINKKYTGVSVNVECKFIPGETIFGKKIVWVESRNDKIFVVLGFSRGTPMPEPVGCKIISIK